MVMISSVLALSMPPNPPVEDSPRTHWVYEGLQLAEEKGLLAGYPKTLPGPHGPMSRYAVAVAYYATGTNLKNIDERMSKDLRILATSSSDSQEAKDSLSELQSIKNAKLDRCFSFMAHAQKEFTPELKTLGAVPTLISEEMKEFHKLSRMKPTKPSI